MTQLVIFSRIRFWSKYFVDQGSIFTMMNKEEHELLLDESNPKDWILFGEISMG